MRFKLIVLPFLLFPLFFVSSVRFNVKSQLNSAEIEESIMSIKYIAKNQAELTNNLYTSSIDFKKLKFTDKTYVNLPHILATLTYSNNQYGLCDYRVVGKVTRGDGNFRYQYVATYVYESAPVVVSNHGYKNNGNLSEIHYSYEITDSFEIVASISDEIGTGAKAFGFGAKAGITSSLSSSDSIGAGASISIQYDLDRNSLTVNKVYSIVKQEIQYNFITIAYNPTYSTSVSWSQTFYEWGRYNSYAFITNALSYETFSLQER